MDEQTNFEYTKDAHFRSRADWEFSWNRGYYEEGLLEEFLDSKVVFYNRNESDNDDATYKKNNEQQQLPEGSASSCNKILNDFAVYKDQKQSNRTLLLAEDVIYGFGN